MQALCSTSLELLIIITDYRDITCEPLTDKAVNVCLISRGDVHGQAWKSGLLLNTLRANSCFNNDAGPFYRSGGFCMAFIIYSLSSWSSARLEKIGGARTHRLGKV